jgi:Tfp pilus assembly protein PilN
VSSPGALHRLDIGFEPRPRVRGGAALVLAFGVLAASAVVGHYQVTLGRLASAQAEATAAHRERPGVDPRRTAEAMQKANLVALELARPWDRTFVALEAVDQPGVALLAIDPDPRRDELRITAEAKDMSEMLAYLEQLKGQPSFGSVALQQHEIRADEPARPVRFTLIAQWKAER